MRFEYRVVVDANSDGTWTATIDDELGPLRAVGPDPIAALRELVRVLADWQQGGAERWLDTPAGTTLARRLCPTFEPRHRGPAS